MCFIRVQSGEVSILKVQEHRGVGNRWFVGFEPMQINPLPSDKFNNNHIDLFRFFTKFDVFITSGSWGSFLSRDICLWVRIPAFFPSFHSVVVLSQRPAFVRRVFVPPLLYCPRQLWSMSMSIQWLNTGRSPHVSKILVRRDYHSTKAIRPIRSSNHTDSQSHNLRISSKNKDPFFLGNPVLIASLLKKNPPQHLQRTSQLPPNCGFDTLQRPPHGHRI